MTIIISIGAPNPVIYDVFKDDDRVIIVDDNTIKGEDIDMMNARIHKFELIDYDYDYFEKYTEYDWNQLSNDVNSINILLIISKMFICKIFVTYFISYWCCNKMMFSVSGYLPKKIRENKK